MIKMCVQTSMAYRGGTSPSLRIKWMIICNLFGELADFLMSPLLPKQIIHFWQSWRFLANRPVGLLNLSLLTMHVLCGHFWCTNLLLSHLPRGKKGCVDKSSRQRLNFYKHVALRLLKVGILYIGCSTIVPCFITSSGCSTHTLAKAIFVSFGCRVPIIAVA